jgi:predicted flap endonuclease-1-like 5' DNA nuclease
MDATEYFLTYSALFVAALGVVFFLVGMFFGTLLSAGLRSRLKDCQNKLADHETSSALLKNQIAELQGQFESASNKPGFSPSSLTPALATDSPVPPEPEPEPEPPTEEETPPIHEAAPDETIAPPPSGTPFHSLLVSGEMINDEQLGAIYAGEPHDPDDLTAIKGIGKVLNGKLNNFGIYKFQQIALWDEALISEFSQRMPFKDRILRDDWPAQARNFHKEKYHEDI